MGGAGLSTKLILHVGHAPDDLSIQLEMQFLQKALWHPLEAPQMTGSQRIWKHMEPEWN